MKCDCANCPTHACYTKGVNCTGVPLEAVKEAYTEEELKLMQAAAYVEGTFYSNICRLQETAEFAKAMGYKKLGMSFCIGLNAEARYIAKYFKQQGFEFYSVCCKNCSFPKKELGLKQVKPELEHEAEAGGDRRHASPGKTGPCTVLVHSAVFTDIGLRGKD